MSDSFERRRLRVYVAGPISKGDVWENVITGIRWGRTMLRDGLAPYVPHLDAYLTLEPGQAPPEDGHSTWNALLEWDLEWVSVSDAIFRIAGESRGADLECNVATKLGIPVYHEAKHDAPHNIGRDYDHDWPDYGDLLAYAKQVRMSGVRK